MIKIEERDIYSLKKDWEIFINQGNKSENELTYCQTWDWNNQVYKYWNDGLLKKLSLKILLGRIRYFNISKNNVPKVIVPIRFKNGDAYIIGSRCGQNYFDFIYADILDEECVLEFFKFLKYKGIKNVHIPLIREKSFLFKFISDNKNFDVDIYEGKVESLDFEYSSFDEYFKTLSKSTRQNIRTAYNRMEKDGVSWDYSCTEEKLKEAEASELISFYCQRHDEEYRNLNIKGYIRAMLRKIILGKWRHHKVVFYSMQESSNQRLYKLYINNELAAYYYGLIYPFNKISFKQVAINNKFSKYSPGIVLAMEIFKRECNKYKYFDFTVGTESYKYKLGCKDERCYKVNVHL